MSCQNFEESGKTDKVYMENTPHVSLRQSAEEKKRGKEIKVVYHTWERMNRGSGIKDRDDRSSGMEIRIVDDLAKINPTDPLM